MKKLTFSLPIILTLALVACGNKSLPSDSNEVNSSQSNDLQYLQRNDPTLTSMEALFNGKVVVHEGCIKLTNKGHNHFTVAIWPQEYKVEVKGNDFVIHDNNGRLIAKNTTSVQLSGGNVPHYKELDMRMNFPENCRAKNYFSVGLN